MSDGGLDLFGLNLLGRVQRFGIRALRLCLDSLQGVDRRLVARLSAPNVVTVRLPISRREIALSLGGDVARAVYLDGVMGYEPRTMELWCKLCQHADIVLDIGANCGLFSLVASDANPECHIAAFEPLPQVHEILKRNIMGAGFGGRIRAECTAISNKNGIAEFLVKGSTGSTLEHAFWADSERLVRIDVPCSTLDVWLARNSLSLTDRSLIKLDVETHEPSIIEGAAQALEAGPAVICEVLATFVEERLNCLVPSSRWRYFWIGPDGPSERKRIIGDPSWRHNNYLFLTKDSPFLSEISGK